MKKLLSIMCVVFVLISFVGCSSTPSENPSVDSATGSQNSTVAPETVAKPVITDYSVAGMMNVTDVYFSGKTSTGSYSKVGYNGVDTAIAITVDIMCPQCGEETFDIIDFSDISENLIGQQTFSWTDEKYCLNWDNHSDSFDSSYKYSIIFTLNG